VKVQEGMRFAGWGRRGGKQLVEVETDMRGGRAGREGRRQTGRKMGRDKKGLKRGLLLLRTVPLFLLLVLLLQLLLLLLPVCEAGPALRF
jgi:hypothetical protein